MKAHVSLDLPQALKRTAEECAQKNGVSLDHFITQALAEKVRPASAAEFFAERGKGADAKRAVRFLEARPG
ncbi:MAG: pilus assembly protein HicB [Rhodobacteraceae bacterium]|nr:pilus assembly protein HicB [Paracoccaceae bacterium]